MVVIGMSVFLGFACRRSPRLFEVSLVQSLQDFANSGFVVYCDTWIAASLLYVSMYM